MNKKSVVLITMVGIYTITVVPGILILGHALRKREKQIKQQIQNSNDGQKLIWSFGDGEGRYVDCNFELGEAFRNYLKERNPETSYSEIAWRIE